MPNLYRRKDSPYWWCWGHYSNGERWQQSTRQGSKREATQAARAIERERLNEADSGYPAVPLRDALDTLREHKRRRGASDATMRFGREKRARLEDHFGEERDVLTITLADTEQYVEARRLATVNRKDASGELRAVPISDHTIQKELGLLRSALRVLRKHDLYPGDPADIWPDTLSGVYTPRSRWLTPEEYRALLDALPVGRRKYVVTYCNTGMRLGELYQSRREGNALVVSQTKGKKQSRVIPLADVVVDVLDADPLPWPRWASNNMSRDLRKACAKAGIPMCSANDFRRTFCSWLVQAGVPELTIIRLMGHTSSAMVRQVYAQLSPETLADAIGRLPT